MEVRHSMKLVFNFCYERGVYTEGNTPGPVRFCSLLINCCGINIFELGNKISVVTFKFYFLTLVLQFEETSEIVVTGNTDNTASTQVDNVTSNIQSIEVAKMVCDINNTRYRQFSVII